MQKTTQARRLAAAAVAVSAIASFGVVATPALAASKVSSNKALTREVTKINKTLAAAAVTLSKSAKNLQAQINTLTTGLGTTNTNLTATNAKVASLTTTVTSLSSAFASASTTVTSALTQLQTGLTSIQTALNDTKTGLVGLNNARPRFVALTVPTSGPTAGQFVIQPMSSTPEQTISIVSQVGNAVIVDFGEDVSQRVFLVNGIAGANGVGQAVDCGAAAAAGAPCFGTDSNTHHVLVTTEDVLPNSSGGTAQTPVPVTVVALAG